MKKIVSGFVGILCLSSVAFASQVDICDKSKIETMLKRALDGGATIIKTAPSLEINGYCEVALSFRDKFDLIYVNTAKNHFLASAILVSYDETKKDYMPSRKMIEELSSNAETEKYNKVIDLLKDKKNLDEYFTFASADKSLKKDRKYDVLLFESKSCGYCKQLEEKLNNKYKTNDVGIYRIEVPLSMNDYNDLRDNYYKSKEKLDKALELKNKLLDGVPLVLVRDAITKEYVEIFQSPNDMNFSKFINYLETKK